MTTTDQHTSDRPDSHCPYCGTELATATVDLDYRPDVTDDLDIERAELQPGEMAQVLFCPNEHCPGRSLGEDLDTGAQV